MDTRLSNHFDGATLQRGRDYARRGLVVSVEPMGDDAFRGRVSNGRGETYQQRIELDRGLVDGICSCPVGENCKHVAAVLVKWTERRDDRPGLAAPVQGWLTRVKQSAAATQLPELRPEGYPENVKDRLLYVLAPHGAQAKIDICKDSAPRSGVGVWVTGLFA